MGPTLQPQRTRPRVITINNKSRNNEAISAYRAIRTGPTHVLPNGDISKCVARRVNEWVQEPKYRLSGSDELVVYECNYTREGWRRRRSTAYESGVPADDRFEVPALCRDL